MRIAELETFVIANPPPSHGGAYFVVAKLTTDDGIVGYGEAYGSTFHPDVVTHAIDDLAEQCLIGEDPRHVERFWRRAYSRGFTQRPDVTVMAPTGGGPSTEAAASAPTASRASTWPSTRGAT